MGTSPPCPQNAYALGRLVLEINSSRRSRRGGGNVEIGLIDFQGRWEGWETALSFSTLSTDRHFHRLLWLPHSSRGGRRLRLFAMAFELHRAEVVQCGVHALTVVPQQPCKHHVLGLANGFEALSVQSLHLQRSEKRLRHRVIPAVALAAHRSPDAVPIAHPAQVLTGLLAAAIAMKD